MVAQSFVELISSENTKDPDVSTWLEPEVELRGVDGEACNEFANEKLSLHSTAAESC